jgi:hypothetical protein
MEEVVTDCNFARIGERIRNANRVVMEKSLENCLLERHRMRWRRWNFGDPGCAD